MTTNWRRIAVFLAITFAVSWSHWLSVIASQRGWITTGLGLSPIAIFGPLVGAIAVSSSRERFVRLARGFGAHAPGILVVALLLPPAIFATSLSLASAIAPLSRPLPPLTATLIVFIGMFITAGVGEEIGWRGFLLPELRRSLSANRASALIALIWFAWHLPLFWVRGSTQSEMPLAAFAAGIGAYSFIITWVTERSGSTIAAMLFHASANTMFWLGLITAKGTRAEVPTTIAFVTMMATLAVIAGFSMRNARSRHLSPVGTTRR